MNSAEKKTLTDEENQLLDHLHKLRLPGMAEELRRQFMDPNTDLVPSSDRIAGIINAEWSMRFDKKFNKYLKQAMLRYPTADIDDTIYDPARQLDAVTIENFNSCLWIDQGKGLLVTGSSSSGKTYLVNALCVAALRKMKTVHSTKASRLMDELEQSRTKDSYFEYIDKLFKFDLLVIDDFGLMELDMDKCRDLFEIIDSRDGRKSTAVISQLPVESWFDLFSENTYADACLTRLTDRRNSYRLVMNGKNMRET